MTPQLEKKVNAAIKLLQTMSKAYGSEPIEVGYSGGKDSDVILELTKMSGIPYRAIYRNTTIDPPGTIKHVQDMGVEIVRPKKTFFQLIEQKGFPSRFARFCCSELKEYKIMDKVILGIRKEESAKRSERYQEPTQCRIYKKGEEVEQILPILDWTIADVQEFVEERRLKLAPMYYRDDGTIDYTRRLGCIGCPLASTKKRIAEFRQYPKFLRQYLKRGAVWWNAKPRAAADKCDDIYEYFAHIIHDGVYSKCVLNKEAMFKTDYKKALEDYFKVKLD